MSKDKDASNSSSFRRIINKFLHILAKKEIFTGYFRARIHKMRGVVIHDVRTVFIGDNVTIDSINPSNLTIGRGCQIGSGTKIVTHFVDTENLSDNKDYYFRFYEGKVVIEENVFIGFNVVIARPVTIGAGSIVGANSVVTQDVPPGTIVMGVPAVVIKTLEFNPRKPD